MIKFFRHIRKSLLEKSKIGKYFKYAIGEIILVMVGIILAVQVNQSLENNKLIAKEKETIKLLLRDIQIEKDRLLFYKTQIDTQEQGVINILKMINNRNSLDSVYHYVDAALDNYVHKPFKPIYQGLIQNGELDLIRKQELRDFLINHFEETNNYLVTLITIHDNFSEENKKNLDFYFPKKYGANNTWKNNITGNSKYIFNDPKVVQTLGSLGNAKNWLSHRIDTYFIVRSDSLRDGLNSYLKTLK